METATEAAPEATVTDPRAIRSREALIRSTLQLLADHPAEQITATDVVSHAKVSRPTLYQHFGDVSGLIVTAVTAKLQTLFDATLPSDCPDPATDPAGTNTSADADNQASPDNADGTGIQELLQRLQEEAEVFRNALHGSSGYRVMRELSALLAHRLRHHGPVHRILVRGGAPDQLAEFAGHGTVGIVADWLDVPDQHREDVATVTRRVTALLHFDLNASNTTETTPDTTNGRRA